MEIFLRICLGKILEVRSILIACYSQNQYKSNKDTQYNCCCLVFSHKQLNLSFRLFFVLIRKCDDLCLRKGHHTGHCIRLAITAQTADVTAHDGIASLELIDDKSELQCHYSPFFSHRGLCFLRRDYMSLFCVSQFFAHQ